MSPYPPDLRSSKASRRSVAAHSKTPLGNQPAGAILTGILAHFLAGTDTLAPATIPTTLHPSIDSSNWSPWSGFRNSKPTTVDHVSIMGLVYAYGTTAYGQLSATGLESLKLAVGELLRSKAAAKK